MKFPLVFFVLSALPAVLLADITSPHPLLDEGHLDTEFGFADIELSSLEPGEVDDTLGGLEDSPEGPQVTHVGSPSAPKAELAGDDIGLGSAGSMPATDVEAPMGANEAAMNIASLEDMATVANVKAVSSVNDDNPDTLSAGAQARSNLDDTSFLKTAGTDTDSVPEAGGMNEPSTGFGTAAMPNDETVGVGAAPGVGRDAVSLSDDVGFNGGEEGADPVSANHASTLEDAGKLDLLLSDINERVADDDGYDEDDNNDGDDDEEDFDGDDDDEELGASDVLAGGDPLAETDPLRTTGGAAATDPIPASKTIVVHEKAPVPVPEVAGTEGDEDVANEAAHVGSIADSAALSTSDATEGDVVGSNKVSGKEDAEDDEDDEDDEDEDEGEDEGEDEDEDEDDDEVDPSAVQAFLSDAASMLHHTGHVSNADRESAAERIAAAQAAIADAASGEDDEDDEDDEDNDDDDEEEGTENGGDARLKSVSVVDDVQNEGAEGEAAAAHAKTASELTASETPDMLLLAPEPHDSPAHLEGPSFAASRLVSPGGDYEPAASEDRLSSPPRDPRIAAAGSASAGSASAASALATAVDCSACEDLLPAARAFIFRKDLAGDRNPESIEAICSRVAPAVTAEASEACASTLGRFGISPLAYHLKVADPKGICSSFRLCDRPDITSTGVAAQASLDKVLSMLVEGYVRFPTTAYQRFWKQESVAGEETTKN